MFPCQYYYEPSGNVIRWLDKIGKCEDVLTEASNRIEELKSELSNVDLKMQDILHSIEFTDKLDMYKCWNIVNSIRDLRKKRRQIKDEKLILSGIKTQGIGHLNRKSVQKCIDGLGKRKYSTRIIDDDE